MRGWGAGRPAFAVIVTALVATLGLTGAAVGGAGVASSCTPGVKTIRGFQARVFCGPAKARVTVNRKTFAIGNGVCERHATYFLVNIGTVVTGIGRNKPKLAYFGLIMGRSPAYSEPVVNKPGTYHRGLITVHGHGVEVDLHDEADLKIVLGAGLHSGHFSATKPGSTIYGTPGYEVSGTFSC